MLKKTTFGELNTGDIFYYSEDTNPSSLTKCIKSEHWDKEIVDKYTGDDEIGSLIVNATWLEDDALSKKGELDYLPKSAIIWINEES